MESKNKELDRIITNLSSDRNQSINPLSMILNGIIDAAVMGGIAKYEEVCSDTPPPPALGQKSEYGMIYNGIIVCCCHRSVGKYKEACSDVPFHPSSPVLNFLWRVFQKFQSIICDSRKVDAPI